ncbi:MFS transporter [Nocardia higoensis]|uniref:MFS transporter n=1 Tax=Nocardia higoensis TaxID=228599 RepID=UPI0005950DE2|nr:MFS transporter [Nocardia higoensis]
MTSPTTRTGLPWVPLLALATAVFITSLTETLPAGLLPGMSESLGVSDSAAGQTVSVYAAGTALTAIPLAKATARMPRKAVLLWAMAIFAAANTVTAASPVYPITLAARVVAGIAAGLAWAVLAGYARRLASAGSEGRAIAIAMIGIPVALSLGVPAGTFIGQFADWRVPFAAITVLTLGVIAWIAFGVPDVADESDTQAPRSVSARTAMTTPGVAAVMAVVLVFVLGHTVLYAYIAPYLAAARLGSSTDLILLVFGAASLVAIWSTGRYIDTHLRMLTLASSVLFIIAGAALATAPPVSLIWLAAGVWGLGWGGVPTLLQTAGAKAASAHSLAAADTAQAVLVTLWNAAMALGGLLGGLVLAGIGPRAIPAAATIFVAVGLAIVAAGHEQAFPALSSRERSASDPVTMPSS